MRILKSFPNGISNVERSLDAAKIHDIEQLHEKARLISLKAEVMNGLQNNKEYLLKIGTLSVPWDSGQFSEKLRDKLIDEHIKKLVETTFQAAVEKHAMCRTWREIEQFCSSYENGAVINLLILSGVARCIVATDWLVDRTDKAAKLEQVWERKYGEAIGPPYKRLDRGPGNCTNSFRLRNDFIDGKRTRRAEYWIEEGIGDNLYFSPESILERFLTPEARNTPGFQEFKKYLGLGLRRALKRKWYSVTESSNIYAWQSQLPFFDLNDIFPLLACPDGWLEELWLRKSKKFKTSKEFEDDSKENLSSDVQELFLEYKRNPGSFISKFFQANFARSANYYAVYLYSAFRKINLFHEQGLLDLNYYAQVFWQHFIRGNFSDIPKKFEKGSVHIQTSKRSDSHPDDADFKRFMQEAIDIAAQGGCIITDGANQSYSRVFRFHEIYEIVEERPDVHVDVFFDKDTHKPVGVLIQKGHPELGFFNDKDKKEISIYFGNDVYYENIARVMQRPDLRIANDVRLRLKQISRIQLDIYRDLHDIFETWLSHMIFARAERNFLLLQDQLKPEPKKFLAVAMGIQDLPEEDEVGLIWDCVRGTGTFESLSFFGIIREYLTKHFSPIQSTKAFSTATDRASDGLVTILTPTDIVEITEDLAKKVAARIENDSIVPSTINLHPLGNVDQIYVFRQLRDSSRLINTANFSKKELPNNAFFSTEAWKKEVEKMKRNILEDIFILQEYGIKRPISLLIDPQCITNDFLQIWLQDLLEDRYDEAVDLLPLDFRDFSIFESYMEGQVKQGKCLIAGGSWQDSYRKNGMRLKRRFEQTVAQFADPNSLLRGIFICFFGQIVSDIIGQKYCNNRIRTIPGPLEMGPTPITIKDRKHALFRGIPEFTAAMTHSGHIVSFASSQEEDLQNQSYIRPLAVSGLTNVPAISEAFSGKIFLIQPHLELSLVENSDYMFRRNVSSHVKELMEDVSQQDRLLRGNFGVDSSIIMGNWEKAVPFLYGNPTHLLTRALYLQLKALVADVEAKHRSAPQSIWHTAQ